MSGTKTRCLAPSFFVSIKSQNDSRCAERQKLLTKYGMSVPGLRVSKRFRIQIYVLS
jgi:hypothetical protein